LARPSPERFGMWYGILVDQKSSFASRLRDEQFTSMNYIISNIISGIPIGIIWGMLRMLGYLRPGIVHPPLPLDAGTRKVLVAGVETNQQ